MSSSKVKLVSIIAVTAMILCAFFPIVNSDVFGENNAADQNATNSTTALPFNYVSLGDSMTTGFGISYDGMYGENYIGYYSVDDQGNITNQRGFLKEVDGTYPTLITKYLAEYYDNVSHMQLGMSGIRSVEMRAFLYNDDTQEDYFPGDDHTRRHFIEKGIYDNIYNVAITEFPNLAKKYQFSGVQDTFTEESRERAFNLMCEIYQRELTGADLITYNSLCNFGHAIEEIADLIRGDEIWKEFDYSLYFNENLVKLAEEVEAKLNSLLAEVISKYLLDLEKDVVQKYLEMANGISKILAYSVISYCADYDAIMEYIDDNNNKDAKVIIIDPYNQFADLSIDVLGHKVSLSSIYEVVLATVRDYTIISDAVNHYCNIEVSHVTVNYTSSVEPRTFGDEFVYGNPSDESKAALMYAIDQEQYAPKTKDTFDYSVIAYDTIDANGKLTELMQIVFSNTCLNIKSLASLDTDKLAKKVSNVIPLLMDPNCKILQTYDGCIVSASGTYIVFTNVDLFLLFIEFTAVKGDGILFHPNANGHGAILQAVSKEFPIAA